MLFFGTLAIFMNPDKTGAELLLIDDKTGTIEVGKEADLIVVTNNPLKNIRTIQDVVFVMSNGEIALKRIPFNKE